MTIIVTIDTGTNGVVGRRMEGMNPPSVNNIGLLSFTELANNRLVLQVPIARVVSMEFEDNQVALIAN